jgi:predicted transposase YbfD/YdcC
MMNQIVSIFSKIEDKRRVLSNDYDLNTILVSAIIALISGADTWNEIQEYCCEKEEWLSTFLNFSNGVPSHDTYNRVISGIEPVKLDGCFMEWVRTLIDGKGLHGVINLDGKTIKGAKNHGVKSAFHMVSAWSCESNLVLGQLRVNEKSNEITAIPKLLDLLDIENCTVTIDAMGCQTDIVEKIIKKKADYILAVKGNQAKLLEDIEDEFRFNKLASESETTDLDHGRIETRKCSVIHDLKHAGIDGKWEELKSVIRIQSTREFKNSDRKKEEHTRYYISNLQRDAEFFQATVRSHWSIENKLHWTLDVAFKEDMSRKRKNNSAQNFALISKIALNILKNDKTSKVGVKSRRLKAGWSTSYIRKLLGFS